MPPLLYDFWNSSACYRVRIALGLKGLDWQAIPINLRQQEQHNTGYRARNPQGLVPTLEIDGLTLTQSLAIIEYLDETRPEPPLLPADPVGRARVRAMAGVIAMEIAPVCMLSVAEHVETLTGGGHDTMAAWMKRFIPPGLAAFEALLDHPGTGRFCHGDQPGLADICLVPQIHNAEAWGIGTGPTPRIARITAACQEIRAFRNASPNAIGLPGTS